MPLLKKRTVTMYDACRRLCADNRKLADRKPGNGASASLGLASPEGDTYGLFCYRDRGGFYVLFPPGGPGSGDGAFMYPDGTFDQGSFTSREQVELIIATYTPVAALYARCARLFAANRALVNLSNGCCDGYLGLRSPGGGSTYQVTYYRGLDGYYAAWPHPETGGPDDTSFVHPGGQFTQRGPLTPGLVESIAARFTPFRLQDDE
jgi:hypothetical protein